MKTILSKKKNKRSKKEVVLIQKQIKIRKKKGLLKNK